MHTSITGKNSSNTFPIDAVNVIAFVRRLIANNTGTWSNSSEFATSLERRSVVYIVAGCLYIACPGVTWRAPVMGMDKRRHSGSWWIMQNNYNPWMALELVLQTVYIRRHAWAWLGFFMGRQIVHPSLNSFRHTTLPKKLHLSTDGMIECSIKDSVIPDPILFQLLQWWRKHAEAHISEAITSSTRVAKWVHGISMQHENIQMNNNAHHHANVRLDYLRLMPHNVILI